MARSPEVIHYQLGKRDAIAELLMTVRVSGEVNALRDVAMQMEDNPHAAWYLKQNPKDTPDDTLT